LYSYCRTTIMFRSMIYSLSKVLNPEKNYSRFTCTCNNRWPATGNTEEDMAHQKLAFIGGTGLYQIEGMEIREAIDIDTPFGKPSDSVIRASYKEREVFFLPRHGRGHRILPNEIPVQANIYALKKLGVGSIIAVSAVGSLKSEIRPRDIVVPSQLIDRTKSRPNSFFGDGVVGHVSFADPFCPQLREILYSTIDELGHPVHQNETYVCMEGPLFSTRAESNLYRTWGGGIIGMTALPEAKLAREAEICYATMALSTDYDCWKVDEKDVTIEIVVENLQANSKTAQNIIKALIENIPEKRACGCHEAAKYAIITDKSIIPKKTRERLSLLYSKYWE
jgi:5'-methylthioadenosine phosphorylase